MKLATFNVNSVRLRLPAVLDWMAVHEPAAMALQETKVEDAKFPGDEIEELGLHAAFHGQKAQNGLAIVSRSQAQGVRMGFGDPLMPEDCRIMTATVDGVTIINTYVPNGTQVGSDKFFYKLRWLAKFETWAAERFRPTDMVVWMGDINIAPGPDDVYDWKKVSGGIGYHPDEHAALARILEWGWTDCFRIHNSGPGHFSYFDYFITDSVPRNRGWRIDMVYASPALAERCTASGIDMAPRKEERPSDHTVVWADFDL